MDWLHWTLAWVAFGFWLSFMGAHTGAYWRGWGELLWNFLSCLLWPVPLVIGFCQGFALHWRARKNRKRAW